MPIKILNENCSIVAACDIFEPMPLLLLPGLLPERRLSSAWHQLAKGHNNNNNHNHNDEQHPSLGIFIFANELQKQKRFFGNTFIIINQLATKAIQSTARKAGGPHGS